MDYKAPTISSLCVSLKGHDKGRYYIVVKVISTDFVMVADGKQRLISNAKLKRYKHLKVAEYVSSLSDKIINQNIKDTDIKKYIKDYMNKEV